MKSSKSQAPGSREHPDTKHTGRARHSVRAAASQTQNGAHGVTRPTLIRACLKFGASLVLGCWCLVLLLGSSALAQFVVNWHTIDGGGGTSTGGVYQVSSTIGQHDAGGLMTSGPYSVTGGFWSLYAVQTPGAPTLTIAPAAPGNATISWTTDTPGYVLQQTTTLSPVNWTNSPSGATNPIVVPVNQAARFYRLFKS